MTPGFLILFLATATYAENAMPQKQIENIIPILAVKNLDASIAHYQDVLGFEKEWAFDGMGSVRRDGFRIMLGEGDYHGVPGRGRIWMGVQDADVFHKEYVKSGAKIAKEPQNYPHAYEFQVADLDGNIIRIGSGPKD